MIIVEMPDRAQPLYDLSGITLSLVTQQFNALINHRKPPFTYHPSILQFAVQHPENRKSHYI